MSAETIAYYDTDEMQSYWPHSDNDDVAMALDDVPVSPDSTNTATNQRPKCKCCLIHAKPSQHLAYNFKVSLHGIRCDAENTIYHVSKLDAVKNSQIPKTGAVTIAYIKGTLSLDAMPAERSA